MKRLAALLGFLTILGLAALAQDDSVSAGNDNFLMNLLERQLSTPTRQIRLHGVTGALSSRARIEQVTISDPEGTWLAINNVELDWSRLALLRGRVNINRLSADTIVWSRKGAAAPAAPPTAEARPFSLPELPVSVDIADLSVGRMSFAEPVFGRAAELSVNGALNLAGGALRSDITVRRLDGPGGEMVLKAGFANDTRQLDIDLDLHEPQGGVVATLLDIEGQPAIDLTVDGSGPLDRVDVNFVLDAAGERVVDGVVALNQTDAGLGFDASFDGRIAPLVPERFRDFFAGDSTIRINGVSKTGGGLRVSALSVDGAVLQVHGGLETGPDNLLRKLALTGTLGDAAGQPVVLPVPGGGTRLQSAALHVDFGNAARWNGLVVLDRLETADIAMEDVTLRLGGLSLNLDDPARRTVTATVEGLATGVWHADPEIARTLGSRIDLFADIAIPPKAPIEVRQMQVSGGNGLSLFTAGTLDGGVYTGRTAVKVADLSVLQGVARRPLSGEIDLRAVGSVTPLSGGFDLGFEGGGTDLALGDARLDRLLAGTTAISGRAVRDTGGFRTENFRIENPQLSFASNGRFSSGETDIRFDASLADLAAVDPRLSGSLTATGTAKGSGRPVSVEFAARVPSGSVENRALANLALGFTGEVDGSNVTGSLDGSGALDGLVLDLQGAVALQGERRAVDGLVVAVGPNRLTGSVERTGTAPATGHLSLDAPDIGPVAALALVDATGALKADVTLDAAEVGQGVGLTVSARGVAVGSTRVGTLDADARITDALGLPMIDGRADAADLVVGGIEVASAAASAQQVDRDRMGFAAQARLVEGTLADASGELSRLDGGFAATLNTLSLRQAGAAATLKAPSTVTIRGGTVDLTPLALDFGSGSLTAKGSIADSFDIDVAISTIPLALANTIRPDLGLAGTVNGTARVGGPRSAPDVRFDLAADSVASSHTRDAGLPPVNLRASGTTSGGRLNLDANVSGPGLSARARGAVPLGEGSLDLTIDLDAFPLALVDRAAGNRGLRGTVTGQARVGGTLADPAVTFNLSARGLGASVSDEFGLPQFALTAKGGFRQRVLTLNTAQLTGGGAQLDASGRVPLAGPGLDLRANGTVPMSLANPFLAEQSAQVAGVLRVNASATGALSAPQLGGTLSLAGGTVVYPDLNIRLNDVGFEASLQGQVVRISDVRASVVTGGTITGGGQVTISGARGHPADFDLRLNSIRYTDGQFVSTRLDGGLTMRGPLVGGGGLLSGTIDLGRTEISIAEGLGASQAALEQVDHVHTPQPVQQTLDRARLDRPEARPGRAGPGIGLDVRINAPSQIFVRGRGLDAELGGSLRVRGTTTDLQPVGQFDLVRGRLSILSQRIEFTEGSLQLVGNLDPLVHFVASTDSGEVTAIVTVDGRVSAPRITFSSDPPLPQDEVLARLLFSSSTDRLSAFQVAQLAAAAAELAGTGGPGFMSQLRGATGLDDLDVITQDDGSTAVRAGKYLASNVYVDVQTGTDGVSRAEIQVDLSRSVTARGSVGSDGNSTVGLFYERDY